MKPFRSVFACAVSAAAVVLAALEFGPSIEANAAFVPAPADDFGVIKGRLVYGGDAPKLPEIPVQPTVEFCGGLKLVDRALQVDAKTKGVAGAIVYLVAPKGKNPEAEKALVAKSPTVQIDNKGCEFVPRSTAMHKAQTLEFTNSDPVGHNSNYSPFNQAGKNVAVPPKGVVPVKLLAEKRPIPLACNIHGWMKGTIMVFDHPFFAVTKEDGTFEITGVPPGTQNIVVWQEKSGYVTEGAMKGKPIEVKAGATLDLKEVVLDPAKVKN